MWQPLETDHQLAEIVSQSNTFPQVIFKHSTRCSISSMAKNRLEKSGNNTEVKMYLLDLIKHRNLSNKIASNFDVEHESPQVLIIKNGKCVYDESHNGINMKEILEEAGKL